MKVRHITNIEGGQDGAIFGDFLFRFDTRGNGKVYDIKTFSEEGSSASETSPIAAFSLDKADVIVPHSNSVVFGTEYFEKGDEFPLLYTNIYNNYAKSENKLCGVCCVYRIKRDGLSFSSSLVQLVEIGFTDDRELWRSSGDTSDVRPYGNFVIDREGGKYYGFVMRDADRKTRFFAFDMPTVRDGDYDENLGVRRVRLGADKILDHFDTPYVNFMQGSVMKNGKIYIVEGFDKDIHPAIRIIDAKEKKEILFFDFFEAGYEVEPEFIDFYGEKCIYGDAHGRIFELIF